MAAPTPPAPPLLPATPVPGTNEAMLQMMHMMQAMMGMTAVPQAAPDPSAVPFTAIESPADPDWAPEDARFKTQARQLLAALK